ncbi:MULTISPECIES: pentapeptide repeat-containing protein [Nostoc]|uniref:Pentapeptide repeat-containing protein n=1 Tax=Nostoc paludosum FACHB-159 TaxID=2692908 RepID=A0ABR8KQ18_9NOSO|nr:MULTISPECIES: pentapeptide repeat-containing protein [Nostoc]MBD2683436.1 pentapeptide repeat-containing protein [Nostoc sp. FACHB-857]MBD2739722.1 pentapeptide repeat-containing protein [Nostoc paludosum FACHB-159]
MANEEHLAILRQGVEVWNTWRTKNRSIKPNIEGIDLRGANLGGADLRWVNLKNADVRGANLVDANLSKADLNNTNFSSCDVNNANLSAAYIRQGNFENVDLKGANLSQTDFTESNLTRAILSKAQALGTNFTASTLTGACIEDWSINNYTNFNNVICDYIYLRQGQKERRPSSGNFAPGEFTKLFQKSLETVDLIFRNGIDWDAFAYSFKKVEVENQGAQLDVQSIEKKGDGIILVRVAVAPDADKAKIHNQFMQGYDFAAKALEAQYQARLEDKDKIINQLFSTINQQNKLLAQTGDRVSIYYQPNSQFAGGIVDANTANIDRMGGNIHNNNA